MRCSSVSLAACRAAALSARIPLYQHIAQLASVARPTIPLPMVNIVSGGLHAGGQIEIQDVLAMPIGARSFAQALEWVWRVYHATGQRVRARRPSAAGRRRRGLGAAAVLERGSPAVGDRRHRSGRPGARPRRVARRRRRRQPLLRCPRSTATSCGANSASSAARIWSTCCRCGAAAIRSFRLRMASPKTTGPHGAR